MIRYGFDAVIKSRQQMSASDPVHKPVIGQGRAGPFCGRRCGR